MGSSCINLRLHRLQLGIVLEGLAVGGEGLTVALLLVVSQAKIVVGVRRGLALCSFQSTNE
jgi:hypothetical protein